MNKVIIARAPGVIDARVEAVGHPAKAAFVGSLSRPRMQGNGLRQGLPLNQRGCLLRCISPKVRRFSDAGTHDTSHALRRPASEKRQGTKSRWGIVGGAATMGISPRAQASMWWNVAARWAILPRGICVN